MPKIDLHGEVFYYASVGDGLRFVFQHGMGADTTQPLGFGGELRGWRTIAMDCRGHGHTEASLARARISFAQFSHDLAALLDVLRIERAVIGGISMGAALAVAFGLAHPERVAGLILVRPAWLDRPFPPNLRWFRSPPACCKSIRPMRPPGVFRRCPNLPNLERPPSPLPIRCWVSFIGPVLASDPEFLQICPPSVPVTSLSQCQRLQIPVQVVVNPHDPVHPDSLGEQLAAAIPGAALSRITSKTESEVLHRNDLARVLDDCLRLLREQLSR